MALRNLALAARGTTLRVWTAVLAATWGGLSLHPDRGSDSFFHLMLGREVLRTHERIVTERWALPRMHDRCAVPEWLWDVGAYVVHRAWGWAGVAAAVAIVGALAAWACCRVASRRGSVSLATVVLVTSAMSPLVLMRLQPRPDAAVLVLLPAVVLAAERLATAGVRERPFRAMVVVALFGLWVQVHPSFLLAPVVVAIVAGDRVARADRRVALALAAAFVALSFTSAQGAGVFAHVIAHSGGYTVARVAEWAPPTFDTLDPTQHLFLPAFSALAIVPLLGFAFARRFAVREILLALLGLVLVLRSQRHFGIGAELLVPFAAEGLEALVAAMPVRLAPVVLGVSLVASLLLLLRVASSLDDALGPVGAVGPAQGLFPSRGAVALANAPRGTAVMTAYRAGAPINFWLDGHVRTSIDSRALIYFDDADYAAARATWEDAGALDRAIALDHFDAAVVDRSEPACAAFAARPDWEPAAVDATLTTFARKSLRLGVAIAGVAPCGAAYFTRDACANGGEVLLGGLDAAAGEPFVDYLRVEARIACSQGAVDADALVRMLPSRGASGAFLADRDGTLAWILAHAGHVDEAVSLVSPYAGKGDARPVGRVAWVLDQRRDARLRPMLERLVAAQDEAALPTWVFALLADACAREGKLDCASTYGIFAAAKGDVQAAPALCAVSQRHADGVARREAALWLDQLRKTTGSQAAMPCP